ncbi:MAG: patatin-like phospholipase family protein [Acidithiobacillus sp.]|uniref:patatin-like phospholipase family protein n=1 Tax=Acidithiobacillus sp. TaxID=1872118 RepID=UPI003D04F940
MSLVEVAWSGAGTNGAAEAGAYAALEAHNILPIYTVGTSAGSIVAALAALGKTGAQMKEIVLDADYARLIDYQWWSIPGRWTLASARNVQAWLREITDEQQMQDCQIPLTTVTADLWEQRSVYWRSAEVPQMPVWQAVYSSMAIPYIFPKWLDRYVDGGTMDNLPVAELPGRHKRLALLATEVSTTGPVTGPIDEASRALSMMLSANVDQARVYARAMGVPVVCLPCGNLGFLDRHQTQSDKLRLWQAGYQAVEQFLASEEGKRWAA